jgi:hypothetical protein
MRLGLFLMGLVAGVVVAACCPRSGDEYLAIEPGIYEFDTHTTDSQSRWPTTWPSGKLLAAEVEVSDEEVVFEYQTEDGAFVAVFDVEPL